MPLAGDAINIAENASPGEYARAESLISTSAKNRKSEEHASRMFVHDEGMLNRT